MSDRTFVVASREFVTTVKSASFIFTTLAMPVIGAIIAAIGIIPGAYLAAKEVSRAKGTVAFVDESGLFASAAPLAADVVPDERQAIGRMFADPGSLARALRIEPVAAREEALDGVRAGRLRAAVVVPADWLEKGTILFYEDRKGGELAGRADPGGVLRTYLVQNLLASRVDPKIAARAERPIVARERYRLAESGEFEKDDVLARMTKLVVPVGFVIFLLVATFTSASFLMQGVAEEKENRVLEVILSSVSARELFAGKLLGLGGAGLVQLAVWSVGMVVPAARFLPFVEVSGRIVAIGLIEFVLGYLLFGSLMLGFGALGSNFRESQKWAAPFSVIGAGVPALFIPILIDDPASLFARFLAIFPITAPMAMTVRAGLRPVPVWEVALSVALTAITVAGAVWLAARVYRAGTLLTGSKVTLGTVWNAMRRPDR